MSPKPTTTYGATTNSGNAGTKTTTPVPVSFLSHAESLTATSRPWREFFNTSFLSLPINYNDALSRMRRNVNYFRVNYVLVMLFVLFGSLLWHPLSMIVFIIVFLAWLFFYFARDDPVVVFNQILDDRLVLCGLTLVTILALVLTDVGVNVLVGLMVAVVLIGLHASFRTTDDLFLDEESAAEGGLVSVVGSQPARFTGYTRI